MPYITPPLFLSYHLSAAFSVFTPFHNQSTKGILYGVYGSNIQQKSDNLNPGIYVVEATGPLDAMTKKHAWVVLTDPAKSFSVILAKVRASVWSIQSPIHSRATIYIIFTHSITEKTVSLLLFHTCIVLRTLIHRISGSHNAAQNVDDFNAFYRETG